MFINHIVDMVKWAHRLLRIWQAGKGYKIKKNKIIYLLCILFFIYQKKIDLLFHKCTNDISY